MSTFFCELLQLNLSRSLYGLCWYCILLDNWSLSIATINAVTYFAPIEPVIKDPKIFLHTVDHMPCLLFCKIWGIFPANPIGMHFPLQKFIELLDKPFFPI